MANIQLPRTGSRDDSPASVLNNLNCRTRGLANLYTNTRLSNVGGASASSIFAIPGNCPETHTVQGSEESASRTRLTKTRWSEEDLRSLAQAELDAPPSAMRAINEYLSNNVSLSTHRGAEALKSVRRRSRYKQILSELRSAGGEQINEPLEQIVEEEPNVNLLLDIPNNDRQGHGLLVPLITPDLHEELSVTHNESRSINVSESASTPSLFQCLQCPRSFPSKRSLSQHMRHSHNNANDSATSSVLLTTEPTHLCSFCDKAFCTKIGLGQHMRHLHPKEYNDEIVRPCVRPRWHDEDLRRLASAEVKAPLCESNKLNNYLFGLKIVDRSLDGIRRIRDSARYKDILEQVRGTLESHENPIVVSDSQLPVVLLDDNVDGSVDLFRSWLEDAVSVLRRRVSEGASLQHLLSATEAALAGESPEDELVNWFYSIFGANNQREVQPSSTEEGLVHRTNRQDRRHQYARVQTLWKRNRTKAAKFVLDGDNDTSETPSLHVQEEYWRPIFENPARRRATNAINHPTALRSMSELINVCSPVQSSEVKKIQPQIHSASGPDGVSPKDWLSKTDSYSVAVVMNILLLWGHVPTIWRDSRTVLIPKKGDPTNPASYRPISISSVVLRHLHKIIADRVINHNIFDKRQRGFIHADGTAENVTVLAALLDHAQRTKSNIHIVSIDAQKAFDTVDHQAIDRVLAKRGFSRLFRVYFSNLYLESFTFLEVSGQKSSPIHPTQGVRQGDPFSSVVFNLVMDEVLAAVDPMVGYRMYDVLVNALSFADDLDLISSTREGMQGLLDSVAEAMSTQGLSPAPHKCTAISMMLAGKIQKMKIVTEPLFQIQDHRIKQFGVEDTWKHLGVNFSIKGPTSPVIDYVSYLQRITQAPLKPQQRLIILRTYLVPRFIHSLVLGKVSFGLLDRLDRLSRSFIRKWVKLPHDVTTAFFHSPVPDGGLGIFSYSTRIPELIIARLERLELSYFDAARAASRTQYVLNRIQWAKESKSPTNEWAGKLHASTDGAELRQSRGSSLSTGWLYRQTGVPPRDWLSYLKVRINALPTLMRTKRGMRRNRANVMCRGLCNSTETAAHVIQCCHRTHGGRVLRHNAIVTHLVNLLQHKGFEVWEEPRIQTAEGLRKPDIVAKLNNNVFIIDAQVVSGSGDLELAHSRKRNYYASNLDLIRCVAGLTRVPCSRIATSTVTISWRGIWAKSSAALMRLLGLPKRELWGLTTRVLLGSYLNFIRFNSTTTVASHNTWPYRVRT